ncbi:MAG: alpha/beta fold hydrolase, partial [Chitinophagaceae bacterium]
MSLYHLVRKPAVMLEKNPVLVLLHGYGSNEEDLFSFASELPQEYFVVSARAPFDMSYSSYAWYAIDFSADEKKFSDLVQAAQSRDRIVDFLDKLPQQYPIDPDQITLVGFSQGAILSYAVALSHPDKIKQVAALSGYLNTDIVIPGFDKNDFSKLRFFISHGSVDQVVPVD